MRTQRRRDPSWCPDMVALTSQEETAMLSLSDKSRSLIEATLPVVGEHIEEIAEHFYRHLFTVHPELLDGTFNRGNQAEGTLDHGKRANIEQASTRAR